MEFDSLHMRVAVLPIPNTLSILQTVYVLGIWNTATLPTRMEQYLPLSIFMIFLLFTFNIMFNMYMCMTKKRV